MGSYGRYRVYSVTVAYSVTHTCHFAWIVVSTITFTLDVTGFAPLPSPPPGKDATNSFEDVGHSADAREMQKTYVIGVLSSPTGKKVPVSTNREHLRRLLNRERVPH